jgi:hypothetical protein
MTTQTPNQSRPIKRITPSMVLCCNVLGGTENDKSLVSTATFNDNLPPFRTSTRRQHAWACCKGLAEVRIEDHLLVFFEIWQRWGQSAYKTCMIPCPFTICQFGILINFSSTAFSGGTAGVSVRLLSLHWHRFPLSLSKYCSLRICVGNSYLSFSVFS